MNRFSWTPRINDTGSRYLKKNLFSVDLPNFEQLNHAFKGPIWQKIGNGSNLLSQLINLKV